MNRRVSSIIMLLCLALPACNPALSQNPAQQQLAAGNGEQCKERAQNRLSLFDRPDTYPISTEEKQNAYTALYNECMKEFTPQVATAKPGFQVAGAGSELANLSPAAGGNQQPRTNIITYTNGAMVIDTTQLSKLSPAAGGTATGITSTVTGNGSTVVVVQAPPSTAIAYPPQAPIRPAAIAADATPIKTMEEKPVAAAEKAKPVRKARKKATTQTAPQTGTDGRTRFEKNAVPVQVDLTAKPTDMNTLTPSAGKLLDGAVETNKLSPKD